MLHKIICPLFQVTDIRFSKCSEYVYGNGRNRLKFGIHASASAFLTIRRLAKPVGVCWHRAAELLVAYRTLRKSYILHKSQMPQ